VSAKLKPANQHPDFGKVCIHGSLKRQCYTCELEGNNDFLKKGIQIFKDEIDSLEQQNEKYREALEKIKQEPDDECGGCNLKGYTAKEALKEGEEK
jgi:hypothetical protein